MKLLLLFIILLLYYHFCSVDTEYRVMSGNNRIIMEI